MTLRSIIVDDEPLARKGLEEDLREIDFIEIVGTAENSLKAIELVTTAKPDLVFLDIEMPKVNGLELIKSITQPPMVVITSAYSKYAMKGYELDVTDYLLKPIDFNRLLKACIKAKEFYQLKHNPAGDKASANDYFFVKCDGKYEKVIFDELFLIEAANNYVFLHTKDKKLMTYSTMKNIQQLLPESKFMRVHKSYIIAIDKIHELHKNELLINNIKIPVSRNVKDVVLNSMLNKKNLL